MATDSGGYRHRICRLPPQHLVTRDTEPRDRLAHELGHGAEILDADVGARVDQDAHHRLAKLDLRRLVRRHEIRRAAVERPHVGAIEAHEVIDAKPVVQLDLPSSAHAEPREIVLARLIPVVRRKPPLLAGLAERIRRRADRRVEQKIAAPAPDIGAVQRHHERKIAEDLQPLDRLSSRCHCRDAIHWTYW